MCRLDRAALHELEKDTADKFIALNLDQTSHAFRNTSRGIHYQDGIERVDNKSVIRCVLLHSEQASELVMGHFSETQPNPKFLDPTQPNP